MKLSDRPTGEILVLSVTFTVCFGVLASGATIGLISLIHPSTDISNWVARIAGILNTMIGLLAGFLAGRTDREQLRGPNEPTPPTTQ